MRAEIQGLSADVQRPTDFDDAFRARLRDLLVWRRDVRCFRRDPPPAGTLERLIHLACLAPSVGLSQPWRFVVVDDPTRRAAVRENFERCNVDALAAQSSERTAAYARLKLAGLDDAPCHLAVFADRSTAQGHGLGRHTMPEMIEYSAVTAVHTIWLAARAEGIGVGWVSILESASVAAILEVPSHWKFIAYLCLGFPQAEDDVPDLERKGWEERKACAVVLRR
jgi:5,6-dimethylbenzimidazole synthase